MKKVIYRIQFKFEGKNTSETRNNKLISLLSNIENIDTESPIIPPPTGSIIEIDGEEFEITSRRYSFVTEEDVVYYTTILILGNKKDLTDSYGKLKQMVKDHGEIYKYKHSKFGDNPKFGNDTFTY